MLGSMIGGVLDQRSVLVAFGLCAVLLGALGWLVAAWRGWTRIPAVLAGISLAFAVAVTQARHPLPSGNLVVTGCTLTSPGASNDLLLNIVLLVPFGLFASLAARRIVAPALCCVAAAAVFETMQGLFGTGFCVAQDATANSAGGICAAVVGWLIVRSRRGKPLRASPGSH